MTRPSFMYLSKPDKSDPLNLNRVLSAQWGDFYFMVRWHVTMWFFWRGRWLARPASWPRLEAGRISRRPAYQWHPPAPKDKGR